MTEPTGPTVAAPAIAFRRELRLLDATMLVVGSMIGSGIFMLPASLAPFGANAVAGWIVSGLGAVCLAYCIGRLARAGGNRPMQ